MRKGEKRIIVHNKIREHRTAVGVSRQGLADVIGVSKSAIIALELYKWTANQPNAEAIADFFGVDVPDIFYIPNREK